MSDEEGRAYTVAELITALQALEHQDAAVSAFSGCHDCGGPRIDIWTGTDGYGDQVVQLSGEEFREEF